MLNSNSALRKVVAEDEWTDVDLLMSTGGELKSGKARWYANVDTDTTNPSCLKMCFGQAMVCMERIQTHVKELAELDNAGTYTILLQQSLRESAGLLHLP